MPGYRVNADGVRHARELIDAEQRAAQDDHPEFERAADELPERLDQERG